MGTIDFPGNNDIIFILSNLWRSFVKSKIVELLKSKKDIILYLFFGVLTTIVNYLIYFPCLNFLKFPAAASNLIAWAVAVIFAFLTNKPFVFQSNDWSVNTVLPELVKFTGTRVASGLLETGILFLTVDLLLWNGNIWKIITSVLVVVLNYIGSKLLVFKN